MSPDKTHISDIDLTYIQNKLHMYIILMIISLHDGKLVTKSACMVHTVVYKPVVIWRNFSSQTVAICM